MARLLLASMDATGEAHDDIMMSKPALVLRVGLLIRQNNTNVEWALYDCTVLFIVTISKFPSLNGVVLRRFSAFSVTLVSSCTRNRAIRLRRLQPQRMWRTSRRSPFKVCN